jgi:hypothetical protein
MAQDNMVLFAKKLKLESNWNELFLEKLDQSLENKRSKLIQIAEITKHIFLLVN